MWKVQSRYGEWPFVWKMEGWTDAEQAQTAAHCSSQNILQDSRFWSPPCLLWSVRAWGLPCRLPSESTGSHWKFTQSPPRPGICSCGVFYEKRSEGRRETPGGALQEGPEVCRTERLENFPLLPGPELPSSSLYP